MLKRDFILVQIEELGKMVAQMTLNRNANDGARENPELIQSVYDSLRIDADFLLRGTPEEIHRTLNRDDDHGLPLFFVPYDHGAPVPRPVAGRRMPWGRGMDGAG